MNKICLGCFKTISDQSRVEIYEFLASSGFKTVSEVVAKFNLTQPTVSYHLKELEKVGLVNRKKKGRRVYYSASVSCVAHKIEHCPIIGN